MIRFVEHHTIDKVRWDQCVAHASNGLVYGMSWYLDVVAPGWHGVVKDDYSAVMPLPHRRKWGIDYVHQPPYCQQLGVFGHRDATEFLNAIPSNFRLIDLQLNSGNVASGTKTERRPNLLLDLDKPFFQLREAYSTNTLRNIRKSTQHKLKQEPVATLEEIITLFRQHRGKNISTMRTYEYDLLQRLVSIATDNKIIEIHSLRHQDGTLHAGAVFLRSPHGWIYLFSATHPDGRASGAMSAVIDHFIEKHAGEHTQLDFEGSSHPDLHRFYQSFGSKESVYLQLRMNRLPFPLNLFK